MYRFGGRIRGGYVVPWLARYTMPSEGRSKQGLWPAFALPLPTTLVGVQPFDLGSWPSQPKGLTACDTERREPDHPLCLTRLIMGFDNREVTFRTDRTPLHRIAVQFSWAAPFGELQKNPKSGFLGLAQFWLNPVLGGPAHPSIPI